MDFALLMKNVLRWQFFAVWRYLKFINFCINVFTYTGVQEEKLSVEGAGVVGLAAILPGGPLHEVYLMQF